MMFSDICVRLLPRTKFHINIPPTTVNKINKRLVIIPDTARLFLTLKSIFLFLKNNSMSVIVKQPIYYHVTPTNLDTYSFLNHFDFICMFTKLGIVWYCYNFKRISAHCRYRNFVTFIIIKRILPDACSHHQIGIITCYFTNFLDKDLVVDSISI